MGVPSRLRDGTTPIAQPANGPQNTSTRFTLPDLRTLTVGQTYHWAVQAISSSGQPNIDIGQFKTSAPPSTSPFSSVSVLTHGFTLLQQNTGIPTSFYNLADSIADVGDGLILRYNKPTGYWIPVNESGQILTDLTENKALSDPTYLSTLAANISANYQNKPLVLLPEWSVGSESVIPDTGFTEAAADAFFTSLVQLDQALGGSAGFNSAGDFVRTQGAVFNSPLHFMGFSRGAVVNSEIIQRLGVYYPIAGGTSPTNRDLQMTTIDPHDFNQPSLKLSLFGLGIADFSEFNEPKVQVWDNVTFADNYYQSVADPNGTTATPNGRALSELPAAELNKNPRPAGLNFPEVNGVTLGQPDLEVLLGTRAGQPGRNQSRFGFTRDDGLGGPHLRTMAWYTGTVDLALSDVLTEFPHASNPQLPEAINDQLGERSLERWLDPGFSSPRPWYSLEGGEGIGEGWFYSVLGGGKNKRPPQSLYGRVPVTFDNTLESRMRGDYAVPTLFNGNFDSFIPNRANNVILERNAISQELPGWSFHKSATSPLASPTSHLKDWNDITTLANYRTQLNYDPAQHNYALELSSGESITHNRFVVPDWGVLRFNLHVPNLSLAPINDKLNISIKTDQIGAYLPIGSIELGEGANIGNDQDNSRINYGRNGFETFQVNIPNALRGQIAMLRFETQGNTTVYLDDVFFKSVHLKFGNPTLNGQEARTNATQPNNYLLEKPQYTVSYNRDRKIPNWVSWQLNSSWLGNISRGQIQPQAPFRPDPALATLGWQGATDSNYTNSGYTRGHMTASADRNREQKDIKSTYLTTNILPQHPDNNNLIFAPVFDRPAWTELEHISRNEFVQINGRELYIIAGGYDYNSINNSLPNIPDPNNSSSTIPNPLATNGITVPAWTWKVILSLDKPGLGVEDVTSSTTTYAVITPNIAEPPSNSASGQFSNPVPHPLNALLPSTPARPNLLSRDDWRNWQNWAVNVSDIEYLTNLDLLPLYDERLLR